MTKDLNSLTDEDVHSIVQWCKSSEAVAPSRLAAQGLIEHGYRWSVEKPSDAYALQAAIERIVDAA